jgi:hypothetical protein
MKQLIPAATDAIDLLFSHWDIGLLSRFVIHSILWDDIVKGTIWPDWIYMRVVTLDRP